MSRVLVELRIDATPWRVWRALVDPVEVAAWDGVDRLEVPAGYPAPGQHARWRTGVGPFAITLHDRIQAVDPGRRLASSIDVGFVHLDEEYRLTPEGGGTILVSDNAVAARVPGLGPLATVMVRRSITASMGRLRRLCEASP